MESQISKLLETKDFSDFKIVCGDQEFQVHRAIICPQSSFFEKVCKGAFMESQQGQVALDEDPKLVKTMIEFMYNQDYWFRTVVYDTKAYEKLQKENPSICDDVGSILGYSQFPQLDSLKPMEGFCNEFNITLSAIQMRTAGHVYALADKYDVQELKNKIKDTFKQFWRGCKSSLFPGIVHDIYTMTPDTDRGLRDLVSKMCSDFLDDLIETSNFKTVLGNHPELAIDILGDMKRGRVRLSKMVENLSKNIICPSCEERSEFYLKNFCEGPRLMCGECEDEHDWI